METINIIDCSDAKVLHSQQIKGIDEHLEHFPYCSALHLMRYKGSQKDQNVLEKAALFVPDRRKLAVIYDTDFQHFLKVENEQTSSEQILKKKNTLESLDELAKIVPNEQFSVEHIFPKDTADMKFDFQIQFETPSTETTAEVNYFVEKFTSDEAPKLKKNKKNVTEQKIQYTDFSMTDAYPHQSPQPKSSFASWLRQFKIDEQEPLAGMELLGRKLAEQSTQEMPRQAAVERKMKSIASQSVAENDKVYSETLADLLAMQGQKTKAIEMFGKLILIFPEKSSYFARKIEKLK